VVTPDGFDIPVQAKELVLSGNYTMNLDEEPETVRQPVVEKPAILSEKHALTSEKPAAQPSSVADLPRNVKAGEPVNLILGFIPEDPGPVFNNRIACYLINDSPYFAYYVLGTREIGNFTICHRDWWKPKQRTSLLLLIRRPSANSPECICRQSCTMAENMREKNRWMKLPTSPE
jgi:hypothetical protein